MTPAARARRMPARRPVPRMGGLAAAMVLLAGGGCTGHQQQASPVWINTIVAANEPVRITPAMSVADRLVELRRAKDETYRQLTETILALQVDPQATVKSLVAERPQLQQEIDAYIHRVAVVDVNQGPGLMEVRAHVEVGTEFLSLLRLKTGPPPVDRNAPSTGIVHPL